MGSYDRCRSRMLIGRTDCDGHLPFQIDCGEEPDTSAVGLSDVVEQQGAVRVQKAVAMMTKLDDDQFVQIQLLELNADVRARFNDAQKMLAIYKMPPISPLDARSKQYVQVALFLPAQVLSTPKSACDWLCQSLVPASNISSTIRRPACSF